MLNMLGNGLKLSSLTIGVLLSLSGVALAESTVRLKPVINPAQVAATGGAHEILAAVKAQLEAEVSEPLTEVGEQNQSQRQTKSTQKDQSATAAT
ncbi:MAG: hypothetical protein LH702_23330, partial [Phormidesmis sp. CAN_BIN44]|nr:hypothetical protein [Phormidesmis sp. CAN_BIN44]